MLVLSVDLRRILTASAIALFGIFAVTVVAQALPIQLLRPEWIKRVCGVVLGGVSFPLIGMVLVLLASEAEQNSRDKDRAVPAPERPVVTNLRRLSWVVAIGFVLMIPLQTWASLKEFQQVMRTDRQQLVPYEKALGLLRLAETNEALLYAISTIPGAPPNLSGTTKDPLPVVRQNLINEIEPQVKARQNELKDLNNKRWQLNIVLWVKGGLNAAFCALAFGAIGRLGPTQETLASGLLMPSESQRHWRRAISSQKRNKKRWPWSKRSASPGKS